MARLRWLFGLWLTLLALPGSPCDPPRAEEVLEIGDRKLLSLDPSFLERAENVTLTFHQPTKADRNPVLAPTEPWEGEHITYGTVLFDPEERVFKMWYQTFSDSAYAAGDYKRTSYICYAQSRDGLRWEKPKLGLIEFQGSKENNIVLEGYGHYILDGCAVIRDPADPDPRRRYKLVFYDTVAPGKEGICAAFSPDGIHWEKDERNPLFEGHYTVYAFRDESRGTYVVLHKTYLLPRGVASTPTVRMGMGVRVVVLRESPDFFTWSPPIIVLRPDEGDPPDVDFYGMAAVPYDGLFIGLLNIFHNNDRVMEIELTWSRDHIFWYRTRRTFLPTGPRGAFDSYMVVARPPLVVGDQIWIYYSARNAPHYLPERKAEQRGSVGLARLRLDGFAAWKAGPTEGMLLTKPLRLQGDRLFLNARTDPQGYLIVEVLDRAGRPMEGFARSEAIPFQGDAVRHEVQWSTGRTLRDLRGHVVRFRLWLKHAELYALTIRSHGG